MKPSDKGKLDQFIESCIKQFLFEGDDTATPLEDMLQYIQDEEKRTKTEINNDNRIKGAQINPDERKIKETNIKRNNERLVKMKKIETDLTQQITLKKQQDQSNLSQTSDNAENGQITGQISGQVNVGVTEQAPIQTPAPVAAPVKKKPVRVMFDKSTGSPFYVDFSERGFAISGTRLSFELVESALSKEFNIVLDHGKGLTLDQVRMQKILKYKDRF